MTERPILFSGPMVRAILSGRKTMTRRIIKPQPWAQPNHAHDMERGGVFAVYNGDQEAYRLRCPYGGPGDRLWVRETWAYVGTTDPGWLVYRADYPECARKYGFDHIPATIEEAGGRWKPSIHMPRRESRITLLVTEARVERLHAISETDAEAEGAEPILVPPDGGSCPYIEGFRALWDSINGAGAWGANPWVWVVRFVTMKEDG